MIRNIYSIRRRNFFAKNCTIYSDYTALRNSHTLLIYNCLGLFIFALIPTLPYLTNEIGIPSKYLGNCYPNCRHNSSSNSSSTAYYFVYNKVATFYKFSICNKYLGEVKQFVYD